MRSLSVNVKHYLIIMFYERWTGPSGNREVEHGLPIPGVVLEKKFSTIKDFI